MRKRRPGQRIKANPERRPHGAPKGIGARPTRLIVRRKFESNGNSSGNWPLVVNPARPLCRFASGVALEH
jgi:hypothetical protein